LFDFISCISPIDGKELVRKPVATEAAVEKALADARAAQKMWRKTPLEERKAAMLRFMDAMTAMNQQIVPELAQMMGRPVRYGGEFSPFEARVKYMVEIAEEALAPIAPKGSASLSASCLSSRPGTIPISPPSIRSCPLSSPAMR
jgi:acyl-CoA reductase-like NAD-dependent aldehyde dehydrogenase